MTACPLGLGTVTGSQWWALTLFICPSGCCTRDSSSDFWLYHALTTCCQVIPSGDDQGLHPANSVLPLPRSSAPFSVVPSEARNLKERLRWPGTSCMELGQLLWDGSACQRGGPDLVLLQPVLTRSLLSASSRLTGAAAPSPAAFQLRHIHLCGSERGRPGREALHPHRPW